MIDGLFCRMLQRNIFAAATVVTGLLLSPGVLSQQCYTQPNCGGDVVSGPTTARECCVGTDDGMSFGVSGGTCTVSQCIDPFEVGYVQTMYTLIEDEGPVRVCVYLTKPDFDILEEMVFVESVDFPSSVYIPDNATLAMPDPFNYLTQSYNMIPFSDYEQQQLLSNHIRNIGINATRRVICYDQPIYDDMRLEVAEYFGMSLTVQDMPPTTVLTEVRPMYDQVAILILDDDEAVVGLERTFYSVSEDVGVVEVCAIVYSPTIDCPIEFPFNVNLSTIDNTAEHTADYISVSRMLSFAACKTRQCVNVTIVSDLVDEPLEEFDITLKRTIGLDTRISLQPVDAMVIIHNVEVLAHTASPSSPIEAGDTVSSVTLPPGVTGTPDPQSERPGVTSTPSVPTTNAQELPSVIIPDNTTSSNPLSLSDTTAVIIGGAVAAIFITTIAIIIVIVIIKLCSHGKAEEHEMDSPAVNSVSITTTPNEAYEQMKGAAITTTPNEAYEKMKGAAITTTPNEAYEQMKGAAITTTPNEAYGQIQQGGGRQEEGTPQYEVVTGHPQPAVLSLLNAPTEGVDEQVV